MPAVSEETIAHLLSLARKRYSVLLTGSHGIGKTTIANYIGEELGIRVKYLSCSTIDPWVDFTGVPVPNVKKRCLEFFRPADLDLCELLLLDEINRTHPKVQNAMLETVQFKSINGVPFKNLQMVWAMQNPPGGKYQVAALDPAMVTRFKARITLTASPSVDYYVSKCKIPKLVAEALVLWWNEDLKDELKEIVDPRTLEALGCLMRDKLDWEFALGEELETEGVPLIQLKTRLGNTKLNRYEGVTLRQMIRKTRLYTRKANTDIDFNIHCVNECLRSRGTLNYEAAEIINELRDDFQMKLLSDPNWVKKMVAAWLRLGALDQSETQAQVLHDKVKAMENTFASA